MDQHPETRPSLLARVRNHVDASAWEEFVAAYRPVIVGFGRRKGLQAADAEDLAQQVLIKVAAAIDTWEPDGRRARFRTWLYRVAQNQLLNTVRLNTVRQRHLGAGSGDTAVHLHLQQQPAACDTDWLRLEYRRQVLVQAARRVRDEFEPATWQAFWRTAIEGQPVEQVVQELGRTRGAVYAARSRVMRRLRQVARAMAVDAADGERSEEPSDAS